MRMSWREILGHALIYHSTMILLLQLQEDINYKFDIA